MLTIKDIQNRQFQKAVRGYKEDEVDSFIDMILLEFEKLTKENEDLKSEVSLLKEQIDRHKGDENQVRKTLEQVREMMSDISESAEKRAGIIVDNAEREAELKVREAEDQARRIEDEHRDMIERFVRFRNRYKKMLEDELYRFEGVIDDMFPASGDNLFEDIFGDTEATEDREGMGGTHAFATLVGDELASLDDAVTAEDDERKTMVLNIKDMTEDEG